MDKKLWTPAGDVPVGKEEAPPAPPRPGGPAAGPESGGPPGQPPTEEELRAQLEMLAQVPVGGIVLEFASTLLTVAQLHLHPDRLPESKLAIDALKAVVDTVGDRLGAAGPQLREALRQVQLLFVDATRAAAGEAGAGEGPGEPEA